MHRRVYVAALIGLALAWRSLPAAAQVSLPKVVSALESEVQLGDSAHAVARHHGGIRLDEARIDSPRGAVASYLMMARRGDYVHASDYLDLSGIPSAERLERGPLLARQLKFVLDRRLWIDVEAISDDPQGNLDDGLPEDRERIGSFQSRQGPIEVRLRRQADEMNRELWRFSPRLVERIPELYREFGPGPLGSRMPPALYTPRFLEIELWQWIGLVAIAAIAFGLATLLTLATTWLAHRRAARRQQSPEQGLADTVRVQARLVLTVAIFLPVVLLTLRLSIPARRVLLRISEVIVVFLFTWMLIKLADVLWTRTRERLEREGRRSAVALAVLGGRLTKVMLAVLGAIVVLQQIGFNVNGLLAGLGVGGIAVALAAQKTVANLFGGFTLATDQPVRIGDFCRFGDKSGWVEDVGMRSTRIRTLDRSIITVPNSEFAEVQLENLSVRDRFRLQTQIGLRYETTPDQLRFVLAELRRMLAQDPRVIPEPLRVRFVGFGAHSLDVEVMTYVATADMDEFQAIREELFLKMMDIVREGGTGFAFPSQTIYTAADSGLDRERAAWAESRVRDGGAGDEAATAQGPAVE